MLTIRRPNAPAPVPDEQLLAEFRRSGSMHHLGQLYERYLPMVYGVCLKVLKDAGKAEDATMAIYEELVKKVGSHTIEHFRGWLYVLARNHCLMEWRKNQRKPTLLLAPEDMNRFDEAEEAWEFELPTDRSPLERCLETLNATQKQSVLLFYYEDKSYKEIADLMAEDVGKIRSFIQNGRRNLKNCIEADPYSTTTD